MIIKELITGKYQLVPVTSNDYTEIIMKKYGVNIKVPTKKYSTIIKERIKKLY